MHQWVHYTIREILRLSLRSPECADETLTRRGREIRRALDVAMRQNESRPSRRSTAPLALGGRD